METLYLEISGGFTEGEGKSLPEHGHPRDVHTPLKIVLGDNPDEESSVRRV